MIITLFNNITHVGCLGTDSMKEADVKQWEHNKVKLYVKGQERGRRLLSHLWCFTHAQLMHACVSSDPLAIGYNY